MPEQSSSPNWRAALRPGPGQIAVAIAICLVTMAIVMQIRAASSTEDYSSLRRSELIQALDGVTQENRRLERNLAQLDRTLERMRTGADANKIAREQATKRLSDLQILAGTAPASGAGIVVTIAVAPGKLTPELLVDAIQEMRDAGAEAIDINGSIRVVGSTWFGRSDDGRLVADGKPITVPVTLSVIGDPHALEQGARFRGGIVSEFTGPRVQGQVDIRQSDDLTITSVAEPRHNKFARPTN